MDSEEWIYFENRDRQALVNTVMNLRASIKYYEIGSLHAGHLECKSKTEAYTLLV
jgi:hypothetical protein